MGRIYKILGEAAWRQAQANGRFDGAEVDIADGFIHFSTAEQLAGTGRRASGVEQLESMDARWNRHVRPCQGDRIAHVNRTRQRTRIGKESR